MVPGAERDERAAGVVAAAALGEPTRRLKSGQDGEREENAGARGDPKHGAPALGASKRLVDKIGEENADRDRELIGGNELSPLGSGGELSRVERGRDRGDADAEAGHEPAKDEDRNVGRERLDERADDEKPRGGEERALAAEMVGDIPPRERPKHGAERDPAGHDLERDRADRELLLDAYESPGDNALIVAEESASQQNDGEDARSAGEGQMVWDRLGTSPGGPPPGPVAAPRRLASAMPPAPPPPDPCRLWRRFYQKID